MRHLRSSLPAFCFLGALYGCCGEVPDTPPDGGGGSGGAGSTTTSGSGGAGGGIPADCTTVLSPSADDTAAIQTAFMTAMSNDVICLSPGTYTMRAEVSLNKTGVTVKGIGATRDDVVLDFVSQMVDDDSMSVTSDGFTIENLSIRNSPNNGIIVTGAEDVVFRNLSVTWDAGSVSTNGAYAIYPVGCTKVLVEDCEVVGAADAGIYVGQSEQIIVRNNEVYGNVAGIEIENSDLAEVYNNRSYDNTAGILVFVLPEKEKKDGVTTNVHDNEVFANNRENFAASGIVGSVPPGIGILIFAADETEVHDNNIYDNGSSGVVVVSYPTFMLLDAEFMPDDPLTDGYAESTYIYDNTFTNNGNDPAQILLAVGVNPLPPVLFDGCEKMPDSAQLCLGMTPPSSFLDANCQVGMPAAYSTDPAPFLCDHPAQPPISLE